MKLQNPDDPAALAEALRTKKSGLHWERLPGLTPRAKTVVDVGAGGGVSSFYRAFKGAKFVAIDPLESNRAKLESKRDEFDIDVVTCAAGARPGKLKINVPAAGKTGKSSFLARAGAFADLETAVQEVEVRRLDDILADAKGPFGLKIDAEGYEREVLLGAPRTLKACNWVVCEISMAPRFVGDPLFAGIYPVLEKAGFAFRDIVDLVRQGIGQGVGDMRRIDAVFVKAKYVNWPRERQDARRARRAERTTLGKVADRLGLRQD